MVFIISKKNIYIYIFFLEFKLIFNTINILTFYPKTKKGLI